MVSSPGAGASGALPGDGAPLAAALPDGPAVASLLALASQYGEDDALEDCAVALSNPGRAGGGAWHLNDIPQRVGAAVNK